MILQDFLNKLFSQPSTEGYEIGCVKINIKIAENGDMEVLGGSPDGELPGAVITIIPKLPSPVPLQAPENLTVKIGNL